MKVQSLRKYVYDAVYTYCLSKGAQEGNGVNNFVPHNLVTAYSMASYLTTEHHFDSYIEIAPEGYIYGYFFSVLGYEPLPIHVDFPPTTCHILDERVMKPSQDILLIEDDVIGGTTLHLVVNALQPSHPKNLALYLGHHKCYQHLENIPKMISNLYIAEDTLDYTKYDLYEQECFRFFETIFA